MPKRGCTPTRCSIKNMSKTISSSPKERIRESFLAVISCAAAAYELPQLFNVLKGDMSLVGPRPIVPPEIGQYGEYGPLFLSVKPGITGYWQVQGRSEIKDFSHRAALDIGYIRDQSLKTDVDILLKTIPAVLRRKGAH